MGTALHLIYTNLFMDRFDIKALAGYHLEHLTRLRLVNDIFMVWIHGEDSSNKFTEYLKFLQHLNKFMHEFSMISITLRHNCLNLANQSVVCITKEPSQMNEALDR